MIYMLHQDHTILTSYCVPFDYRHRFESQQLVFKGRIVNWSNTYFSELANLLQCFA